VTGCDCKQLGLLGVVPEERIAKPLYGQKLYRGFESPLSARIQLEGLCGKRIWKTLRIEAGHAVAAWWLGGKNRSSLGEDGTIQLHRSLQRLTIC
jgi:hypothetical protein